MTAANHGSKQLAHPPSAIPQTGLPAARPSDAEILSDTLLELYGIMANAPVAIGFSRDRRIVRYNPRFGELFGFPGDTGLGRSTEELYPSAEAYDNTGRLAFPVLSSGKPFISDMEMRRQDGSTFWAHAIAYLIDTSRPALGAIWIIDDYTERQAVVEALEKARLEQQAILDNASVGVLFTRDRRIQGYNRRFAEIFGFEGNSGIGQSGSSLFPTQEIYDAMGASAGPLLSVGRPFRTEIAMRRQNNDNFWAQLIGYTPDPVRPANGTAWLIDDLSDKKRAEEALRNALLENEAILENALIGIGIAENGCILRCNSKMEEIFAVEHGTLNGASVGSLYADIASWNATRSTVANDFAAGRVHHSEQELARRDGSLFWASLSGRPFDPRLPRGRSVWLLDDITLRRKAEAAVRRSHEELEQRVRERTADLANANVHLQKEMLERQQAEQRIQHMAYHDSLTGLPNRALLSQRLEQALLDSRKLQTHGAVMFIDLDRFKHINDSLGHMVGDHLLKAVAMRLESAVRPGDTVARQGGDEFVVVLPGLDGSTAAAQVEAVAHHIVSAMATPIVIQQRELYISPSIGISLFPADGADVDTLLRNADTAMYQAKAGGRKTWRFYTASLNQAAKQRFELESLLHSALPRDEFRLYFQPIVSVANRQLASMEVLLRWQQPGLGLVAPDRFIPILEDNGGIVAVGAWVLREACRQLVAWQREGLPVVPLAVNLSAKQFSQPGLLSTLHDTIAATGVDPALLELEITETGLMEEALQTLDLMARIRALGVGLSIDDFGTGYSSLAYLKRFPVAKLKIDRAFVKDSENNADDRAIIAAIMALAGSLGLAVVAEGVETEAQFKLLAERGCQYAQGYLISRPVNAAAARQFLTAPSCQRRLAT